MRRKQQDQQSKMFHDLSSLVLNLLESPPTPIDFSDNSHVGSSEEIGTYPNPPPGMKAKIHGGLQQITPVGFALLLLGISLVLMLCGSVTFFIGFMLLPWVLGFAMVFYVVGLVSNLSIFGRSILFHSPSSHTWKLL